MDTTQSESIVTPTIQDNLLVERVIAGDKEAFTGLVRRYKDRIYQFVCWYAGNDRNAEDLAQEIFIEAFKSIGSFRRESAFNTWLYGLARNVCNYRARKSGTVKIVQESDDFLSIPDGTDLAANAEKAETIQALRKAVEELPPLYRQILLLRDWEQMSYQDIASVLQIPIGTVRSRLHNATVLLAKNIASHNINGARL